MQEEEEDSSTVDEEDRTSALNRRGELTHNIPILPHLPKYAICIKKTPSDFLGRLLNIDWTGK